MIERLLNIVMVKISSIVWWNIDYNDDERIEYSEGEDIEYSDGVNRKY